MREIATTLEDFSVELFYEIFAYLQYHEIFKMFSNLNSRLTALINNMTLMSACIGQNELNIATTELYYEHLTRSDISHRLISLCVSDTFGIDNG